MPMLAVKVVVKDFCIRYFITFPRFFSFLGERFT